MRWKYVEKRIKPFVVLAIVFWMAWVWQMMWALSVLQTRTIITLVENETINPADDMFDHSNIECNCDDPSCEKQGPEGKVAGHIENCSCSHCHHEMGKVSGTFDQVPPEEENNV